MRPARTSDICSALDRMDRIVINAMQEGLPISDRPYADVAQDLGLSEDELIERLARLLEIGVLTRFGPMYNADHMGGANVLAAMRVPEDDFTRISEIVNAFAEVSHNYRRDHVFNMWFVISVANTSQVNRVVSAIEETTGCRVMVLEKEAEFFVGLKVQA